MTDTKNSKKETWKNNFLEFFHNNFIGISHLECQIEGKVNEDCPIVDNWDEIEEKKNSKKGLCALYKITDKNFLVVDATVGNDTDLGTQENIEITLPSKAKRKTEPKEPKVEPKKGFLAQLKKIWTSGTEPKESKNKEPWLKDNEFVLFFNNKARSPNLNGIADYLDDLWAIKEDIKWDRGKSRKKVFLHVENEVSETAQSEEIDSANKDYLFYIADPSITNGIKKNGSLFPF